MKNILVEYEQFSSQCEYYEKSTIFYSSNTRVKDQLMLRQRLRVRYSNNLEKYLGFSNMVGRRKKEAFQNLKDRFRKKIHGYNVKFLSQGGKEIFLKSVLQATPTYFMTYFLLPKSLYGELNSLIARFWWQKGKGKREIH